MGKPRRGMSLLLVRFFLRPVVPSHLSLRPKNRSPCVTIAFPPVQDRGEPLLFCFPKRQKPFLLSDGERARSPHLPSYLLVATRGEQSSLAMRGLFLLISAAGADSN